MRYEIYIYVIRWLKVNHCKIRIRDISPKEKEKATLLIKPTKLLHKLNAKMSEEGNFLS